jgi:hypothetical protein
LLWGSELNTKAATILGGSKEFVPSLFIVGLGPVVTRARVLVHEIAREKELAEQRRAHSVDLAGPEVEERREGHILSVLGLVVKHVNAVKLRVVAALVLAVAADALLAAHHPP